MLKSLVLQPLWNMTRLYVLITRKFSNCLKHTRLRYLEILHEITKEEEYSFIHTCSIIDEYKTHNETWRWSPGQTEEKRFDLVVYSQTQNDQLQYLLQYPSEPNLKASITNPDNLSFVRTSFSFIHAEINIETNDELLHFPLVLQSDVSTFFSVGNILFGPVFLCWLVQKRFNTDISEHVKLQHYNVNFVDQNANVIRLKPNEMIILEKEKYTFV